MKNIKSIFGFSDKKKKYTKDIRVENIQTTSNESISMLLMEPCSISKIVAVGNNKSIDLKFSQQKQNLTLYGLDLLECKVVGRIKFDVYVIVNGEKKRLFFENAKNVSFNERHFDINVATNDTEYFYFSKSYSRLMLQTIVGNKIKANSIWTQNEQLLIQSNDFIKLSDGFEIEIKRFKFKEKVDYEKVNPTTIKLDINKLSNIKKLISYDLIFFDSNAPKKESIAIDIKTNKPVQIGKAMNGKVYPFLWVNKGFINKIEQSGDFKKRFVLDSEVEILGAYFRYKERPVFKKLNFLKNDTDLEISFDLQRAKKKYNSLEIVYLENGYMKRYVSKLDDIKISQSSIHENTRDIKINNIRLIDDSRIAMNLIDNVKIDSIVAAYKHDDYQIDFIQRDDQLIIGSLLLKDCGIFNDAVIDIFAVINNKRYRLLFEQANKVNFSERHFDIKLDTSDKEFFYCSKSFKRLMLKIEIGQQFIIDKISRIDDKLLVKSNDFIKIVSSDVILAERNQMKVTIPFTVKDANTILLDVKSVILPIFKVPFDVKLLRSNGAFQGIVFSESKEIFQIGQVSDNKTYVFKWNSEGAIKNIYRSKNGDITKIILNNSLVPLDILLRFKERPVYKRIEFHSVPVKNEILVELSYRNLQHTFSSIEFIYIQNNLLIRASQPLSNLVTKLITEDSVRKPDIRGTILDDRVLALEFSEKVIVDFVYGQPVGGRGMIPLPFRNKNKLQLFVSYGELFHEYEMIRIIYSVNNSKYVKTADYSLSNDNIFV